MTNCYGFNASLFHFLIESPASQGASRHISFLLRPSIVLMACSYVWFHVLFFKINRIEQSHARDARAQTHEHRRVRPLATSGTATASPALQSLLVASSILFTRASKVFPLRFATSSTTMSDKLPSTDSVIPTPSWNSTQLTMRIWLDDLIAWLPTKSPSYATLLEYGYVINHGKVAVADAAQALQIATGTDTVYSIEAPSPRLTSHSRLVPSATSLPRRVRRRLPCCRPRLASLNPRLRRPRLLLRRLRHRLSLRPRYLRISRTAS